MFTRSRFCCSLTLTPLPSNVLGTTPLYGIQRCGPHSRRSIGGAEPSFHRSIQAGIEHLDWRHIPEATRKSELERYLESGRTAGFDLTLGPVLRLGLIRVTERRSQFVVNFSLVALDVPSFTLVLRDVLARYRSLIDRVPDERRAPPSFRRFVEWVRAQDTAAAERFWTRQTPLA